MLTFEEAKDIRARDNGYQDWRFVPQTLKVSILEEASEIYTRQFENFDSRWVLKQNESPQEMQEVIVIYRAECRLPNGGGTEITYMCAALYSDGTFYKLRYFGDGTEDERKKAIIMGVSHWQPLPTFYGKIFH